jgi:hypothetical protein
VTSIIRSQKKSTEVIIPKSTLLIWLYKHSQHRDHAARQLAATTLKTGMSCSRSEEGVASGSSASEPSDRAIGETAKREWPETVVAMEAIGETAKREWPETVVAIHLHLQHIRTRTHTHTRTHIRTRAPSLPAGRALARSSVSGPPECPANPETSELVVGEYSARHAYSEDTLLHR